MEHIVEARVVDSQHLKLKKPIKIKPGSIVLITIEEPINTIAEDEEWYLLSIQSIKDAYGETEPEYALERIKTPNPDYQP